jgi:hypothetical protein
MCGISFPPMQNLPYCTYILCIIMISFCFHVLFQHTHTQLFFAWFSCLAMAYQLIITTVTWNLWILVLIFKDLRLESLYETNVMQALGIRNSGRLDMTKVWTNNPGLDVWTPQKNPFVATHKKIEKRYTHIYIYIHTYITTLWLFNIAMEHGPFIVGLPIEHGDFPWLC